MNKQFIIGVALSLLVIALSLAAVSALNADITTISVLHGNIYSGSFNLQNDAEDILTNVSCSLAVGTWITSNSCPTENVSANDFIANEIRPISFTIDVPKYTTPGIRVGNLTATGYNSTGRVTFSKTFNVNVRASPSLSLAWTASPAELYQSYNQTLQYNITNTGNIALAGTLNVLSSEFGLNYNITDAFPLPSNTSTTGNIEIITNKTTNIGPQSIVLNATAAGTGIYNTNKTFQILSSDISVLYPYCNANSTDDGDIQFLEITNEDDINGESYKPLESFDIKIKVENTNDDDSIRVVAEAILVKDNDEVEDTDVKTSMKVEKGSKEIITLDMSIPADLEEGNYYVYVKIYSNDDEDNCMQKILNIEVTRTAREIIFDGEMPESITCGLSKTIEGKIVNTGRNDEDKVKVVYSDTLGGISTTEINNLDWGEDKDISFILKAPATASAGTNTITLKFYYDYDEDDKEYGLDESYEYSFDVNCATTALTQTISAETSTAIIGTESAVTVRITNTGTATQTYTISASAEWAEITIVPSYVDIAAGSYKDVVIKVNAKPATAIGAHDLLVTAQHGTVTDSKVISVNVQKSSTPSGLIDSISFQLKNNPATAINVVLVIAIIIVLVLILARKSNK